MAHKLVAFVSLLAVYGSAEKQTRWSRQISSYTSDIGDWVPLPGPVEREPPLPPIKRQAVAEPRILSEPFPGFVRPTGFSQDSYPSRTFYNAPANRQLYLQSVPSAPQNYLSDQGFSQGLRFGLTQPNFPLSQGFVAPQFNFDGVPQIKPRPQPVPNAVKFESSFKHQPLPTPTFNPQVIKSINQAQKIKPEIPKFIDGYRVENNTDYNFAKKKPLLSQKVKFDNTREILTASKPKVEREEVQLLYVPLDTLNRGQFNFRSPLTSAQLLNTELYNQNSRPNPLMQNLAAEFQGPVIKPIDTFKSQEFQNNFNSNIREVDPVPKFSTITTPFATAAPTTPKPKKLKPHQPPLAIFLSQEANKQEQVKVGDVLKSLKNVNTVPVLDSVNPLNAPNVFIGPSSLSPPETYVKFELPYLSNIENIDKKLKQLPFFVAPLSYNTPQGFAKIPFPSPHVGSVVINSLIKDSPSPNKVTTATNFFTNAYSEPIYEQDHKPVTQKPKISYYSTTSPKDNSPNYEQNYYSIEPQSVSTLRPFKDSEPSTVSQSVPIKSGSYFLNNLGSQFNQGQYVHFPQDSRFKVSEAPKTSNVFQFESSTTPRTTVTTTTTTTKPPTTASSQLLDTHNPYSINQAFHFSTPLDYHNFFENEYKEPYVTPGIKQSSSSTLSTVPVTPVPELTTTKEPEQSFRPNHQFSSHNLQNYIPEIRHESDIKNLNYPVYNTNNYPSKIDSIPETQYSSPYNSPNTNENIQAGTDTNAPEENIQYTQPQHPTYYENYTNSENVVPESLPNEIQSTKSYSEYSNYDISYNSPETQSSTTTSTTTPTTTTTRRPTIRTRGRPRYPTIKSESSEVSTRATVTRRPLRERKPLPVRSRYEPNKISTESTRNQYDSSESSTKSSRTRTRGRVQYKPSENDEHYTRRHKQNGKEEDLAYQRDVLHQNYPVTLMERTSTSDIEAITEPSEKSISRNNEEISKTYDTEDAYSYDKVSITQPVIKDLSQQHTTAIDSFTEAPYGPKLSSQNDEYAYNSQNSPQKTEISYEEIKDDSYSSNEQQAVNDYNKASSVTEPNVPTYLINDESQSKEKEAITTVPESEENINISNHEISQEQEHEENIVETTPSYNRVRIRPGVIRQYHQTSSTESSRRKPLQAITYRPAFDKRRTTMRIEDIEADLKTKQIHARPEYHDYKQPVYKPEPSTEAITTSSTEVTTTKRSQFRRRRPNYGSSSTEGTVTRRTYEIKNRFRGRRPTEKPTEKSEVQTDVSTSTVRSNVYSRYSHRPRLSERYNKKPETEEVVTEDQDSNYSINRPKYVAPDSDRWSPKISKDSFKPFNPNNIAEDTKDVTNNRKSNDEELDIITARNEYEDILISVTPATNNRVEKKIPDIPPTLEALVEQSKVTKSDSSDNMSTFESMLEEVMKNLEEQDENEYTGRVMKHKGGEIGEIPPERIISSGENYSVKSTTPIQEEITTTTPENISSPNTEEAPERKPHRRGFWKRVKKVRPVKEEFDVAESQYYSNVVNRLGQTVSKNTFEKPGKGNTKLVVTTYKPNYQFLKDFFEVEDEEIEDVPEIDIPKITGKAEGNTEILKEQLESTTISELKETPTESINPGDMDLGTGSPDPTLDDSNYYSDPTEPTSASSSIDRSDFSFMDYLFGVTASDSIESVKNTTSDKVETTTIPIDKEVVTELSKSKATTESTYIPDEITELSDNNDEIQDVEIEKKTTVNDEFQEATEKSVMPESSSVSSFMNPANIVSTSMSTEISHETEICFRGKCIKTNKNLL